MKRHPQQPETLRLIFVCPAEDYVVLSEEYQILKDRPPVVIQKEDDKSAFLEAPKREKKAEEV